jgi:mannose-6-phosphate isomerase-like protein (cupin superfamily)
MSDYAVKKIGDMDAGFGGAFKRARAELGVSSFGMQFIDMPPNVDQYPEHDHADDGQEEVYIVMSGKAEIEIEGEKIQLDPETVVRVSSGTKRKIVTGDEPVRILALGGVPGKAYEAPGVSEVGAPDQGPPDPG